MATVTYIRTEDGQFQCPHCQKVCAKQNTMYYHIKKNHTDDHKFVCEHCPAEDARKFIQKSAYLQHIATAHPEMCKKEENPYIGVCFHCPHSDCGHDAKTKANILVHFARTHCKDWIPAYGKETACIGCQKTFASSTAYLYHAIGCIKPVPEGYTSMLASVGSAANNKSPATAPATATATAELLPVLIPVPMPVPMSVPIPVA